MEQQHGFVQALFDFSFADFITTKLVRVLYGLSIACSGLVSLALIIAGFGDSPGAGVVMLLIVAPLVFVVSVISARVWLEVVVVVFSIAEHVVEIAERGREA